MYIGTTLSFYIYLRFVCAIGITPLNYFALNLCHWNHAFNLFCALTCTSVSPFLHLYSSTDFSVFQFAEFMNVKHCFYAKHRTFIDFCNRHWQIFNTVLFLICWSSGGRLIFLCKIRIKGGVNDYSPVYWLCLIICFYKCG